MAWFRTVPLAELERRGRMVVKPEARPIALFRTEAGLFACANRCPHEGYPLVEGTVETNGACVLTCNWHNWKFDLRTGRTLVGGEAVAVFPLRVADGWVEIDITELPAEERQAKARTGIEKALAENDYERLVRETARLEKAGGDGLDAVRLAAGWGCDKLRYGMRHALGAAPDWLDLRAETQAPDARLVALAEILGHIATDCEAGGGYGFAESATSWDEEAFVAAIEQEDEPRAAAHLRGALAAGEIGNSLFRGFARAALAHYQNFGHALIYVGAAERLIAHLGPDSAAAVLLPLLRSLVYARREDLLPEFRTYAPSLAQWGEANGSLPDLALDSIAGSGVAQILAATQAWSRRHAPEAIYAVLLAANAWNLLHFDAGLQDRHDAPAGGNFGWLDVTHGVTFARAVGETGRRWPELWPQALLQLACFAGRNAGAVKPDAQALQHWAVADVARFEAEVRETLFDHGRERFILSAHLVKTFCAARAEAHRVPSAAPLLLASANRFLHSPVKGRHVRRTARQALAFVAIE